ncbi:MAG: hypothetical protein VX248_00130 [Pseudomonadota bacterium]|nr:hypothetical protein [Pseudomonadota bacterium]
MNPFRLLGLGAGMIALAACNVDMPTPGAGTTINRSFADVSRSLEAGAAKCLNGTFGASDMTIGGGMISNNAWTVGLDTKVRRTSSQTTLTTTRTLLTGAIGAGPNNKGTWVTAVATPAGSGTNLSVNGAWGSGAIQGAVRTWAKTGSLKCPKVE